MLEKLANILPDLFPGWKQRGVTVISYLLGIIGGLGYLSATDVAGLSQFFADNWYWIMPALSTLAEVFRKIAVNRMAVTGK